MILKIKNKAKGKSLQIKIKLPTKVVVILVLVGLAVFGGVDGTSVFSDTGLAPIVFSGLPLSGPSMK